MDFLHQLHDPEGLKSLIAGFGYLLLFAIIFAETSLLVGFSCLATLCFLSLALSRLTPRNSELICRLAP